MSVYIIDFEDSFTYNIAAELNSLELTSIILHWRDFKNLATDSKSVVILGPGPGHPNEYSSIHDQIMSLHNNADIFLMGICLGHQIIGESIGANVIKRNKPRHGQSTIVEIPDWPCFKNSDVGREIKVQEYNSWVIDYNTVPTAYNYSINSFSECSMLGGERLLSYQFHPESMGTTCPSIFLGPISRFLL